MLRGDVRDSERTKSADARALLSRLATWKRMAVNLQGYRTAFVVRIDQIWYLTQLPSATLPSYLALSVLSRRPSPYHSPTTLLLFPTLRLLLPLRLRF
jgi:hypothetical protein